MVQTIDFPTKISSFEIINGKERSIRKCFHGGRGGDEGWGGEKFLSKCYPIHIQCIYIKICTHNSSKDKKQFPWSEVGK